MMHDLGARVALARVARATYPTEPPFHPSEAYPEYDGPTGPANLAYAGVRTALQLLGLDAEHFGTSAWNPLGAIVRPGDRVVVKPNFVLHAHHEGGEYDAVVTHPSVIRAVVDYVLRALEGRGRVTIADAPQSDCIFDLLRERLQLDALLAWYAERSAVPVALLDVREVVYRYDKAKGYLDRTDRLLQAGDPLGYVDFDLGERSALEGLSGLDRLYGADYDRAETITAHRPGSHRYRVSRTMLDQDVFVSVPKLKVHRKVGITVNVKGLVGINGNKNFIVHHRVGGPSGGGDEYPPQAPVADRAIFAVNRWLVDRLLPRKSRWADALYGSLLGAYRRVIKPFYHPKKSSVRAGDWWGNDTAWRMMMDLSIVLRYGDTTGRLHPQPQRRYISIVDGIIGGQGEGPLRPDPHPSRLIVAGIEPFVVDAACARVMGVDFRLCRWLDAAVRGWTMPLWPEGVQRLDVRTNDPALALLSSDRDSPFLAFEPPAGWAPRFAWAAATERVSLNEWMTAIEGRGKRHALLV